MNSLKEKSPVNVEKINLDSVKKGTLSRMQLELRIRKVSPARRRIPKVDSLKIATDLNKESRRILLHGQKMVQVVLQRRLKKMPVVQKGTVDREDLVRVTQKEKKVVPVRFLKKKSGSMKKRCGSMKKSK
jgi:F0F1-type ATP synthase alpha subunit